jgi:hypothetical protein
VFYLHHMLIFKGLRVREIYPKIAPKSQNIHEKQCLEMLCFLYSFFHVCFSIWSPFWLHFRAPKTTLEPSKSILFRKRVQGGLQRAFCIDFGSQGTLQEAFGIDFGTKWVAFGNVWEGVGEIFGRLWGSAQRTKVRCTLYAVR